MSEYDLEYLTVPDLDILHENSDYFLRSQIEEFVEYCIAAIVSAPRVPEEYYQIDPVILSEHRHTDLFRYYNCLSAKHIYSTWKLSVGPNEWGSRGNILIFRNLQIWLASDQRCLWTSFAQAQARFPSFEARFPNNYDDWLATGVWEPGNPSDDEDLLFFTGLDIPFHSSSR
jgi:hypothetical protein